MTSITALVCLAAICVTVVCAQTTGLPNNVTRKFINDTRQVDTDKWLKEMDKIYEYLYGMESLEWWDNDIYGSYNTTVTAMFWVFRNAFLAEVTERLSDTRFHYNNDTKRQLKMLKMRYMPAQNESIDSRVSSIEHELGQIFLNAKVCRDNGTTETNETDCLTFSPGLEHIMRGSNDVEELKWAWQGWRNATGANMSALYRELVPLQNRIARDNGFEDNGDYWRQYHYGSEPDMAAVAETLYQEFKPLYRQLFAYVRRKLVEKYGNESGIRPGGPIPAHLLGNMWANHWNNLLTNGVIQPYPDAPPNDITKEMQRQNYAVEKLFTMAEDFFMSIGLFEMNEGFWNNSIFVKPKDRPAHCTPYAFDFGNRKDFRINMCTEVTLRAFNVIHHEMGHIEYAMAYKDLPMVYRQNANAGFNEAIGELMSLSATSDAHLKMVGLINNHTDRHDNISQLEYKQDINALMEKALLIVAFIPYGYMIDKYRWDVFNGNITSENYNRAYWLKYQGLVPPMKRTENDFDPGAKYHVAHGVPYFRYFIAFILQFQFYEAMCAGVHTGPLNQCDFYGCKAAGEKLKRMLEMGRSKPWPDAMEAMTGQRDMSTRALIKYFKPLTDWLKKENEGKDVEWLRPGETVESVIDRYFD